MNRKRHGSTSLYEIATSSTKLKWRMLHQDSQISKDIERKKKWVVQSYRIMACTLNLCLRTYTHTFLQLHPRMQSQFFIRICKHKRLISDIIDAETYDAHSTKIACFCDDRVESWIISGFLKRSIELFRLYAATRLQELIRKLHLQY